MRKINNKILRMLILLPGICLVLSASAQKPMSLEDCVNYALENHPQIKLADLDVRDADWQIKENAATAYPQLSAGVNYQYYIKQPALPAEALGFPADPGTKFTFALRNNLSGNVSVNQLLFNNSYLMGIKAAKEYRKYVGFKRKAAEKTVRDAVVDAYIPALLLSENIAILDKNIAVQEDLLNETREVFKAGFAEQLDVDRLDFTSTTLHTERENLIRQKEILIDLLQFAMHMPVDEPITLSDDLEGLLAGYEPQIDTLLDYNQRAEYLAVLKSRDLSEIQVDLYRKHWLPTLSAFAQYQPSYQGNDELFWIPAAIAGLQLSIPIYDGGMARAQKERAMVQTAQVDVQKGILEQGYELEMASAKKQLQNARVRVTREEKNLELAQRIYNTTETKFQEGVGSSLELTQALSGLYQTQGSLIEARYQLLQARIALKRATGK